MGKRSVRENKNIYQLSREELGLTRDKAAEQMLYVSPERIEKIESEKSLPHPDEILAMAKCYQRPQLCNYYCSHECPIGQKYVPEVEFKDLSQITLETLASLNSLERAKNRFIEITVDNEVSEDEVEDFLKIQEEMNKIDATVQSLKLWIDHTVATGKIRLD
ncbi:MAG: helix-turn-helix transcriptional regulator [Lachnospiraceae bacterium]|nr:helix-turn-helix transcriptional regulator [Lachnospiraceae bacterium]